MNNGPSAGKRCRSGQSLVEYGLILSLVTVVCIAGMRTLGQTISAQFGGIATQLAAAIPGDDGGSDDDDTGTGGVGGGGGSGGSGSATGGSGINTSCSGRACRQ